MAVGNYAILLNALSMAVLYTVVADDSTTSTLVPNLGGPTIAIPDGQVLLLPGHIIGPPTPGLGDVFLNQRTVGTSAPVATFKAVPRLLTITDGGAPPVDYDIVVIAGIAYAFNLNVWTFVPYISIPSGG